jgi:hypothetical protein
MLVGVCCECQKSGIRLIYDSAQGYTIIRHDAVNGSPCVGEGTAPKATYEDITRSSDYQDLVSECDGETCAECNSGPIFSLEDHAASCSKSTFKSDRIFFEEEDHNPDSHSWIDAIPMERTSEHNSRPPDIYPDDQDQKNPVVVGTLGALILAAKNGKQKTKRG